MIAWFAALRFGEQAEDESEIEEHAVSGDYSRWTSNPRNDFAAVPLQQGRVLTDADWNEQAVTTQRRIQAEALDVIGRAGVPLETPVATMSRTTAGSQA